MAEGFSGHAFTRSHAVVREGEQRFFEILGVDPAAFESTGQVEQYARFSTESITTVLGTGFRSAHDMALQQERAEQFDFAFHKQLTERQLIERRASALGGLAARINNNPELNQASHTALANELARQLEEYLERVRAGFVPSEYEDRRTQVPSSQ